MNMKKYAVLTNDMQIAMANKNEERKKVVWDFVPRFSIFLDKMRSLGIPIIHLQLLDLDPNKARPYGDYPPLLKGSIGVPVLPEVLGKNDIILEKNKDSGFYETKLDCMLKKLNIESVIITGMQAQICVQTTAADAYFRGYSVIVPSDGVVSTKAENIQRALEWLQNYCAKILTSEQIYDTLSKGIDL